MKVELTVGVYSGDDLVDTVSYEDSVDVSLAIEGVKELYE